MANEVLGEIYFIAAMMLIILLICGASVYFFFKTFYKEKAAKAKRDQMQAEKTATETDK